MADPGTRPTLELLEIDLDPPAAIRRPEPPPEPPWSSGVVIAVAVIVTVALLGGWLLARTRPAAEPPTHPPPGAEGLAELYVRMYLTVDDSRRQTDLVRLSPLGAHVLPRPHHRFVNQTHTVGIVPAPTGAAPGPDDHTIDRPTVWVATVAADVLVSEGPDDPYRSDGLHHYQVAMVETSRGLTFTGLPVRSEPPPRAGLPDREGAVGTQDHALWALAEGFLAAHLTGAGDLDANVTADSSISFIDPPSQAVEVDHVNVTPLGDDRIHLSVTGTVVDDSGSQLLIEHHLIARPEEGAWKIESTAPGPPLAGTIPETSTTLSLPID